MAENKSVLQEVDDEARNQAKALVRTARHGALAHLHKASGTPHVSRVGVATAPDGAPTILISQLSPHYEGLMGQPRCSLLLGEPGKGDPLAHPRITVMAQARRVTDEAERQMMRGRYLARHPKAALYVDFADFAFWVLAPTGAALNGGYGKAYTLEADDLRSPVAGGLAEIEPGAVAHMNADHKDALDLYAGQALADPGTGWSAVSLDAEGLDLMRNEQLVRVRFPKPLTTAEALRGTLAAMAKSIRGNAQAG
ncbi:MAG: HugZ family protein [Devosiaceae bacterium]|nr:HugZ family protein [Devosiaceae bacterium MH13]